MFIQIYRILKNDELVNIYQNSNFIDSPYYDYQIQEMNTNLLINFDQKAFYLDFQRDMNQNYKYNYKNFMTSKDLMYEYDEDGVKQQINDDDMWMLADKIEFNASIKQIDLSNFSCEAPKVQNVEEDSKSNKKKKNKKIGFYVYCMMDDLLKFQKINVKVGGNGPDVFRLVVNGFMYLGLVGVIALGVAVLGCYLLNRKYGQTKISLRELITLE